MRPGVLFLSDYLQQKKRLFPQDARKVSKFCSTYSVTDGKEKVWGPTLPVGYILSSKLLLASETFLSILLLKYVFSWSGLWEKINNFSFKSKSIWAWTWESTLLIKLRFAVIEYQFFDSQWIYYFGNLCNT